MRSDFSVFALFTAGLSAVVSAYTTPVGEPSGNPILKPGLGDIVDAGKPYEITWDTTTPGFVTLVLLRGPSTNVEPLYPIVENTPNTGSYSWTPASDLEDDVTGYGIQLIVDSTGQYQYSTQFGVSNPGVSGPTTGKPSGSSKPSGSGNSTLEPTSKPTVSSSASSNSTSSSAGPSKNSTTTQTTIATSARTTPTPTSSPSRTGAAPSATGAAVKGYVVGAGSLFLAVVGAMAAL
ncbi:hypothetical protein P152DRAFT_445906 [Eremomyces bilateralis CBS 781.70]|uniref:Yeast cell wall synthesis Kre9/Knh1-like N-terminal domain-containing protein n=1 Tax=Eremomyces bilateralis CBS 781.70 TaxID=1392243 RepID=A0A6G1GDV5_9PEZI|nr:uncharacterized protein P152DRAFT_445906 [Eremomyces bilateralis CBS 781.70]KAF1816223.1 hypothetical protein P152DRAFT_445906 [Eremomyces bilateralis CBS 781.70]